MVKILPIFVAFLEKMNFNYLAMVESYKGFFGLLIKPELYQNVQILNLPFFSSVVAGSGTDGEDH